MNIDDQISQGIESMRNEVCDHRSIEQLRLAVHAKLNDFDREGVSLPKKGVDRRNLLRFVGVSTVAASAAIFAFDPFGFLSTKSLYAEAVDNLQRGGLYYLMTKEGQNQGTQVWVSANGRRRNSTSGTLTISDKFGNPLLMYTTGDHVQKSAMSFKITPKSSAVRFEESWIKLLKDDSHAELIGDESISDKLIAMHYRVKPADPGLVFEVWIDTQSKSIVRVEFEENREGAPKEALGKYLITDIKCNQIFDESLFDTTPPEGYEVTIVDENTKSSDPR